MSRSRVGTIEWRKDHYRVRISLPDGTRPWIHLDPGLSETMAREKAAGLTEKAWKKDASYTPKRGQKMVRPVASTIKAISEPWLEIINTDRDLAPATKAMYKTHAKNHVVPDLGKLKPVELTSGVLRRWIRELCEKYAPSTVRNIFNTVSRMVDDAMGEEWIDLPANPTRHPKVRAALPAVEAPEDVRHFTGVQALTLIQARTTPVERQVRYVVGFTSGIRDGELSALKWNSIVEEHGVFGFMVTRSLAIVGPNGFATEKNTKTRAGRRFIPLHSEATRRLKQWKTEGWKEYSGRASRDDDPIFPDEHGCPDRPKSAELLREDLEAAGLPTTYQGHPFEFNDLRHSFSTWLASAGVPKETRDRLMGHAAASVGERHYTARDVELLRQAIETIRLDPAGRPGHGSPPSQPPQLSPQLSQEELQDTGTDGQTLQNQIVRRGSQAVRQWFAKPSYVGSNPIHASNRVPQFGGCRRSARLRSCSTASILTGLVKCTSKPASSASLRSSGWP